MRITSLLLAFLLCSHPAAAQSLSPAQQAQLQRGTAKIAVGAALIGAGAFMMPITSVGRAEPGAGAGLIVAGTGVVLWGMRDRYKATRPQLTFGAGTGRSKAVYIRRSW